MKTFIQQYIEHYIKPREKDLLNPQSIWEGIPSVGLGFFVSSLFSHFARHKKLTMFLVTDEKSSPESLTAEIDFFIRESFKENIPSLLSLSNTKKFEEDIEASAGSMESQNIDSQEGIHDNNYVPDQEVSRLFSILQNDFSIICCSMDAFFANYSLLASQIEEKISLAVDLQYELEILSKKLVKKGYKRVSRVEFPGHFCRKGSIIDIFPIHLDEPVRIDYFDDRIDSIRTFNILNQKSQEKISKIDIFPILSHSRTVEPTSFNQDNFVDLLSLCPLDSSIMVAMHPSNMFDTSENQNKINKLKKLYPKASFIQMYPSLKDANFDNLKKENWNPLGIEKCDFLLTLSQSQSNLKINTASTSDNHLPSHNKKEPSLHDLSNWMKDKILQEKANICLSSTYETQVERLKGIFHTDTSLEEKHNEDSYQEWTKHISIIHSAQRTSFCIPKLQFYFIDEHEILTQKKRKRTKFKKFASESIEHFVDLQEGDIVVHITHGIGKFIELKRMTAAGQTKDFLVLQYAGNDKLFVPLDQISSVQKYISNRQKPRLDSLGSKSFQKTKQRVQEQIDDYAKELIQQYNTRTYGRGFFYPKDSLWQLDFEAHFPYEETPDQLRATEEIKKDMESTKIMDRLLCGDVGYGKTEVAIRAIFKAVLAGKQVAFIAPTTILALQHFTNFKARFASYPITIDWISRFRTKKECKQIKVNLAENKIEIIIGTHSLLSKDIKMPNLGLLIIDEEQRFGVMHKESIKKLQVKVDTLVLSATPIPRTLHMSLMGARDISVIKSPPQNRMPVKTIVQPHEEEMIIDAIQREINRDGQVFYLYNAISTIDTCVFHLRGLFPNLKIAILHAQMDEEDIENVLLEFQRKEYHILVTTTIIENGIDMPNANTLIVENSHRFGLSQLYQIRGRVGRSNRQAYAYLFYPPNTALTETASARLETLEKHQYLGSGFAIAMRDLEIRGAGNILGTAQSGNIAEIGYDLYLNLLKKAIEYLKDGSKPKEITHTSVQIQKDFYIPEDYIPDVRQRIELYKNFEKTQSKEEVLDLENEIEDRFGPIPPIVQTFVMIEKIRVIAQGIGFASIVQTGQQKVEFHMAELQIPVQNFLYCLKKFHTQMKMPNNIGKIIYIRIRNKSQILEEILMLLENLASPKS